MEITNELSQALLKGITTASAIEVTYRDGGVVKGMIKNYDMKDGLTIGRSPQNPGESKLHSVTFDHVAEIKIGEEVYK